MARIAQEFFALSLGEAEPVADDDVVDAPSRLRTCFGGNLKALPAEQVGITAPEVSRQVPPGKGGGGEARRWSPGAGAHWSSPCIRSEQ